MWIQKKGGDGRCQTWRFISGTELFTGKIQGCLQRMTTLTLNNFHFNFPDLWFIVFISFGQKNQSFTWEKWSQDWMPCL